MRSGYITLDCRGGVHQACAVCSCRCHGANAVPFGLPRRRRTGNIDVPFVGFFVMSVVVIALLVVVAVMHQELIHLRSEKPAPQVTNIQLPTLSDGE